MSEKPLPTVVTEPVNITVDGEEITVQNGELLIEACHRNGTYIPRFCYHPRMNPVGMCRMCLVEIDTGRGPALQPSCMIEVTPGMVVDTKSDLVSKVQDGVIEYLLANHPLDCPVCDKGGECPLQDQAYSHGPGESRWVEEKRHYAKPIPISETVYLDRERCILCDRCTRFAKEVAGDPLIHFIDRGANTQVNTFPDEPFASYFSGNTVQICPVGALTAKPYRFKARPWDLQTVESTCTGCSVGCRIEIDSSRNHVLRYNGVDSDPVNWSWLCDKGRFGFESLEAADRLREPLVRSGETLEPASWAAALATAAEAINAASPGSIGVIGGSRLTNESAYAWAKLAKGVIGTDNVDAQLGDGLPADVVFGLPQATIDEVCKPGGTILYLGPDPKEELPVLYLRLKHAVDEDGARIIELAPAGTGLTRHSAVSLNYRPGELGQLVDSLVSGSNSTGENAALSTAAKLIAAAGDSLTVVIGRANLAENAQSVVAAATAIRDAVPGVKFLVALRRGNVRGALEAGLAPGYLPGRVSLTGGQDDQVAAFKSLWGNVPAKQGLDTKGILWAAAEGKLDVLILLGADPLSDFPDRSLARRGVAGARTVIAIDRFPTASVVQADVVLPAAGHSEEQGTTTNLEGRVTVLNQKVTPPGTARPDWMIAAELAWKLGGDLGVDTESSELWAELVASTETFAGAGVDALADTANADGIVITAEPRPLATVEAPHVSPTSAYSLRLVVNRKLYDAGASISRCDSSSALAPAQALRLSPADASPLGLKDLDRVSVTSPNGSLSARVALDSSVPKGTAVLVHNLAEADPGALVASDDAVCEIRVEVG
ncbi:MAG: NADH-quinone oxidoreductase subunit NuoG [Microthrixaceae bacterium]